MSDSDTTTTRHWCYASLGDYHRELDLNWSYAPTYLRKVEIVNSWARQGSRTSEYLDVGCGEGVIVEFLARQGLRVQGIDLNYESDLVTCGSVLDLPYPDESFDGVLFLDVLEHLSFTDQPRALAEIFRVLRPGGRLIASVPNAAHWNARVRMLFFGRLDRADIEENHPGERPYCENRNLLRRAGFDIRTVIGITLTVPILYRQIICRRPSWFHWLHRVLDLLAVPSLALLDVFCCEKAAVRGK